MCVYFACMYVHHMCAMPTEARRGGLDTLGLELQMVVSCHMGARN